MSLILQTLTHMIKHTNSPIHVREILSHSGLFITKILMKQT